MNKKKSAFNVLN